jgi:hypothetical protein
LELRLTTVPPTGAAEVRVTVPVDEVPPATDVGETLTLERGYALIVRTAC